MAFANQKQSMDNNPVLFGRSLPSSHSAPANKAIDSQSMFTRRYPDNWQNPTLNSQSDYSRGHPVSYQSEQLESVASFATRMAQNRANPQAMTMRAAELGDSGFSRARAWPESQPTGFAGNGRNVDVSNENSQRRTNMAFAQSKPRSELDKQFDDFLDQLNKREWKDQYPSNPSNGAKRTSTYYEYEDTDKDLRSSDKKMRYDNPNSSLCSKFVESAVEERDPYHGVGSSTREPYSSSSSSKHLQDLKTKLVRSRVSYSTSDAEIDLQIEEQQKKLQRLMDLKKNNGKKLQQ